MPRETNVSVSTIKQKWNELDFDYLERTYTKRHIKIRKVVLHERPSRHSNNNNTVTNININININNNNKT